MNNLLFQPHILPRRTVRLPADKVRDEALLSVPPPRPPPQRALNVGWVYHLVQGARLSLGGPAGGRERSGADVGIVCGCEVSSILWYPERAGLMS